MIHGQLVGQAAVLRYCQLIQMSPTMTRAITASCHRGPMMSAWSGMSNSSVLRSSKIARMRALPKTQLAPSPAAASMEKSTPAEVGAANNPLRAASSQTLKLPHSDDAVMTKTKYNAHKIHGSEAATAATK